MESTSDRQWSCQIDDEVFGCDDAKLGKVKEVRPTHLVVSKGLLVHTDYYVPTSAINSCEGGKLYLNVTKDEATQCGWDQPPGDVSLGDATNVVP
jgi:hypothetical protein